MTMFDTFDRTGSVEFPFAQPVVLRAVETAASGIHGMKVDAVNSLAGHITIKTGVSAMSWGEKVTVSVSEVTGSRSRLAVASGAKTILGSATTHGKNRKNIEKIIDETSKVLEQHGGDWTQEMGLAVAKVGLPDQPASAADEIKKLAELRDAGVVTPEEFEAKKSQLLGL